MEASRGQFPVVQPVAVQQALVLVDVQEALQIPSGRPGQVPFVPLGSSDRSLPMGFERLSEATGLPMWARTSMDDSQLRWVRTVLVCRHGILAG